MKKLNVLQLIKEKKEKEARRHQASLYNAGFCVTLEKK